MINAHSVRDRQPFMFFKLMGRKAEGLEDGRQAKLDVPLVSLDFATGALICRVLISDDSQL